MTELKYKQEVLGYVVDDNELKCCGTCRFFRECDPKMPPYGICFPVLPSWAEQRRLRVHSVQHGHKCPAYVRRQPEPVPAPELDNPGPVVTFPDPNDFQGVKYWTDWLNSIIDDITRYGGKVSFTKENKK